MPGMKKVASVWKNPAPYSSFFSGFLNVSIRKISPKS